jgi:hypothetical protein
MKNQIIEINDLFVEGMWTAHSHFLMADDAIRGGIPFHEWSDMCRMIGNIDRMMVDYQNLLVIKRQRPTVGVDRLIGKKQEEIQEAFKALNNQVFLSKLSHIRA